LFVGNAAERLAKLPIGSIHVSDSVPKPERIALPVQVSSLAPLLAETLKRLHRSESLGDLLVHG
jgi:ribose-phosphate pyrophosphokinase